MSGQGPDRAVTHAELKPVLDRLERIERLLDELYAAWMQAQGGAKLVRLIFFVIGPIVGAIWWLREHIRW